MPRDGKWRKPIKMPSTYFTSGDRYETDSKLFSDIKATKRALNPRRGALPIPTWNCL